MPQLKVDSEDIPLPKEQVVKKRKLPFGHFKIITKSGEIECKPNTQDEFADGWYQTLPRLSSGNPIHHWSVTLAQLPPHLWKKYRKEYESNKPFYPVIKDNIYYYSVNETKYDTLLLELYGELSKGLNSDNSKIKELLEKVDGQVTGWLITRAKKFLKTDSEKYCVDLELPKMD